MKKRKQQPIARQKTREQKQENAKLDGEIATLKRKKRDLEGDLEWLKSIKNSLADDIAELEEREELLRTKMTLMDKIKEALSWKTEAYKTQGEQLAMMRTILEQIMEAQNG